MFLLHSCHCIFLFVLMCALVLYFAIRNRSKLKTGLNSKEFGFYKKIENRKKDFFSKRLGQNLFCLEAGPA
jgi:hypothetical protein